MARKTKIFISYSRKNQEQVAVLYDALSKKQDLKVFRDTDDILPSEEWKSRLEDLILESDAIVFALSPESASSEVCAWELECAERLNKKIIPVVVQNVDGNVPVAVSRLNYVFLTENDKPSRALSAIEQAIDLDIDWVREHTRLGELADRWDKAAKLGAQPLRGKELNSAEQWLVAQPRNAPHPTELHRRYILESRRAASQRQRLTIAGSFVAVVIVGILGLFAWQQRNEAIEGKRIAEDALRTATKAANTLTFDLASEFKNSSVPSEITEKILSQARSLQESLLKNFPDDVTLNISSAAALLELSEVAEKQGDIQSAIKMASAAHEINLKYQRVSDVDTAYFSNIAVSSLRLGRLAALLGDVAAAKNHYSESLRISRNLVASNTSDSIGHKQVYSALVLLGRTEIGLGKTEKAREYLEAALTSARELVSIAPENLDYKLDLVAILHDLGAQPYISNDERAQAYLEEGLEIARFISEKNPNNTSFASAVSTILNSLISIEINLGNIAIAEKHANEALEIGERLVAVDPSNSKWLAMGASNFRKLADIYEEQGKFDEATSLYEASLKTARQLALLDPTNIDWKYDIAFSLGGLGALAKRQEKYAESIGFYLEKLEVQRALLSVMPTNSKLNRNLSTTLNSLGLVSQYNSEFRAAKGYYEEALMIRQKLVESFPEDPLLLDYLATSLRITAALYDEEGLGDPEPLFLRALAISRQQASFENENLKATRKYVNDLYYVAALKCESKASDEALVELVNLELQIAQAKGKEGSIDSWSKIIDHIDGRLVSSVGSRTHRCLAASEFSAAETQVREAIYLMPGKPALKSYLVHALMFQNRRQEVFKILLRQQGMSYRDKTWEVMVVEDFDFLKKDVYSHPLMDEIVAFFSE